MFLVDPKWGIASPAVLKTITRRSERLKDLQLSDIFVLPGFKARIFSAVDLICEVLVQGTACQGPCSIWNF